MAQNNCSFDTNVLLDWLLDRDTNRTQKIDKLLETHVNIGVADMIIAELAFVLEKVLKQPRSLVILNLKRVIDDDRFNCNRVLFAQVLPLYAKHKGLSFVDCCATFYAVLTDSTPLYTSDKKLASRSNGLAKLI